MKRITLQMLRGAGACATQLTLFNRLFPDGVEPTREACLAHAAEFNWPWAAEHLLSAPARKVYGEAIAPARKVYGEAIAPAWAAYNEAGAIAFADAWAAQDE